MEMRKLNSVCICGRSAYGEMIMCADCFQFFHFRCMEKMGISMPTSKKMIVPFLKNGWRCPDCDVSARRCSKTLNVDECVNQKKN